MELVGVPGISKENWRLLVDGVARGEYNLLLGAGASIGALGGDGSPVPLASDLAEQLVQNFGIETGGELLSLRDAYEYVGDRKDALGRNRYEYLRSRFNNCRPSWQGVISHLRWKRIWSLNVDDVIERAYPSDSRQKLVPYSWMSDFSEPRLGVDELQLVHLHGSVEKANPEKSDLIFSIVEYVEAVSPHHAWHHVFGSLFSSQPFIVIGARLEDEFDLAQFVRKDSAAREMMGRPSALVLKEVSPLRKGMFEKRGFLSVEMKAEKFFKELVPAVLAAERQLPALLPKVHSGAVGREPRIFLNQFQWRRLDEPGQLPLDHDFYKGDEPRWGDIVEGKDAPRAVVARVLEDWRDVSKKETQRVIFLYGSRGSGKTAALYRLGVELAKRNFDIFEFRGDERIDCDAVLWLVRQDNRSVLLIDDAADFSADIGRTIGACQREGLPVLIVCAEREARVGRVFEDIEPEVLSEYRLGRLSRGEAVDILTKLRNVHRLGKLTRRSEPEQVNYFLEDSGGDLLAALLGLEGGAGFARRLRAEFHQDLASDQWRLVYGAVCMAHSLGYGLPVGVAGTVSGLSPLRISSELGRNGELHGFIQVKNEKLVARHRAVASLVIEYGMEPLYRYSLSQLLARALSSYVTINTLRSNSLYYRLARQLMRAKLLQPWLGIDQTAEWYGGLIECYAWTARFWEQRALAELERRDYERARSYAEEALRIQSHEYTLNTLGTVLMRTATEKFSPDSKEAQELFWEAVGHLRAARELGKSRNQHPFVTFFVYSLRWSEALIGKGESRPQKLYREWDRWMSAAKRARYYQHVPAQRELFEFQEDWIRLSVSGNRGGPRVDLDKFESAEE